MLAAIGATDTIKITSCLFKSNYASENGSGILIFGNTSNSYLILNNCVFVQNSGSQVIHSQGGIALLNHCNIFNNYSNAFYMMGGIVDVKNSIIRDTTNAEVQSFNGPSQGTITFTNCDLKNNGYGSTNFDLNPVFADTNFLTLANSSP